MAPIIEHADPIKRRVTDKIVAFAVALAEDASACDSVDARGFQASARISQQTEILRTTPPLTIGRRVLCQKSTLRRGKDRADQDGCRTGRSRQAESKQTLQARFVWNSAGCAKWTRVRCRLTSPPGVSSLGGKNPTILFWC